MLVQIGHAGAINMRGIDSVIVTVEHEEEWTNPTMFSKGTRVVKDKHVLVINYVDADNKKVERRFSCPNQQTANEIKDIVLRQVKEIENVGATQALEEAIKDA
jgi:arginine decarboxylase-like protein